MNAKAIQIKALTAALILGSLLSASAQFIVNPSFELNTFNTYPGYASDNGGTITGWTIKGSTVPAPNAMVGLSPAGNLQTTHLFADNGAVPAGKRVAFIQSMNGLLRTLSATILGPQNMYGNQVSYQLSLGSEYRVTFRANSRLETGTPNPTWSLNSGPFVPFTASPPVGGNNAFYTNTGVFIATNGSSVVTLANQTPGDTAVLLDDFKVEEIAHYTWVLRPWTDDISTAIRPGSTLWAYHFNSSTATKINGVPVPGIPGANPSVPDRFEVTGLGSTFANHKNPLSNRGTFGGGSAVMANDFIYNGNPGIVTVKGLTPGNGYVMSLFGVGFDAPGSRVQTFGAGDDTRVIDENVFGLGNGLRVDYAFTATNTMQSISITPQSASTFHLYGLALRQGITLGLNGNAAITNECPSAYTELGAFSGPQAVDMGGSADGLSVFGAAIRSDSTLVTWGAFDPSITAYSIDTSRNVSNLVAIAAGESHLVALRSDGTVAVLGDSFFNQAIIPEGLSGVTAVAAGAYHCVALRSDGSVATWGDNRFHQTTVFETLTGIQAIAAGTYHSMALRNDGTVSIWGSWDSARNPQGLKNVIRIAAGNDFCMALKQDGTVVTWGSMDPMPAPQNSAVVAIAAGAKHGMALRADGSIVTWRPFPNNVPVVRSDLPNIKSISAHGDICMALGNDGTVYNWSVGPVAPPPLPSSLYFQIPTPANAAAVSSGTPGTYVLNYAYSNSMGVGAIARTVTVRDTTPPVLTLNGDAITVVTNGVYTELGATASDVCGGSATVSTNGSVNPLVAGIYSILYSATDASGNTANLSRKVVVQTKPSIVPLTGPPPVADLLSGIRTLDLSASVNPNGLLTRVVLEHGPTAQYGRTNPLPDTGTNITLVIVAGGVQPQEIPDASLFTPRTVGARVPVGALTEYHWRIVASNALGTQASEDQSLRLGSITPTLQGDLNSDGQVNDQDLKILFDNFTAPPGAKDLGVLFSYTLIFPSYLGMTNVAGLGGTNVTFDATMLELVGLKIESSTDLKSWTPLGTAVPHFFFTDTNALTEPKRFYRLSSPGSSE